MELNPMKDVLGQEVKPGDFLAIAGVEEHHHWTLPVLDVVEVLGFVERLSPNVIREYDTRIVRSSDPSRVGQEVRHVAAMEVPGEAPPRPNFVKVEAPR